MYCVCILNLMLVILLLNCIITTKHEHCPLGIQKENVVLKRKHIVPHKRMRGRVKITDNEELGTDASCSKYDTMRTPEVNKVQEALKSSSLELQAIVTDPLPDALLRAASVLSEMARAKQNHVDEDASNPSMNTSVEPVQAKEGDNRNQSCSPHNDVPKPSLMERNHTARTYEVHLCVLYSPVVYFSSYVDNIICLIDDV